jgi:hypothetical protein
MSDISLMPTWFFKITESLIEEILILKVDKKFNILIFLFSANDGMHKNKKIDDQTYRDQMAAIQGGYY